MGLMFVGKLKWKYRYRAIIEAFGVLIAACQGYQVAGWDHSTKKDEEMIIG